MKIKEIKSYSDQKSSTTRCLHKSTKGSNSKVTKNSGIKGGPVMSFKQICSVCEPTFLNYMNHIKANSKHVIRRHLTKIREELQNVISTIGQTQTCFLCGPVLTNEFKKASRQYVQVVNKKFYEILEECNNIFEIKLRKRYPFNFVER